MLMHLGSWLSDVQSPFFPAASCRCCKTQISSLLLWPCRTLNRIQSRISPAAFRSNENLLVCAPTGAGKTNIAMLAVLREVEANMSHGVIQKQNFKIVYVAPMKALAAEVTGAFSRRLGPLGEPGLVPLNRALTWGLLTSQPKQIAAPA